MNNEYVMKTALEQSAKELNCTPEELVCGEKRVVISRYHEEARRYYTKEPFFCNLVSYGKNVVASVDERAKDFITEYLSKFTPEHCFETPAIHLLTREFQKYGYAPCFMAEYFLPDMDKLKPLECDYEIKILSPDEFSDLYRPEFSNALCEKRKHLDKIAAAAYDNGKIIALAGASADCDKMWQIGIDVLPQYRRQGIAAALTSTLASKITELGIVPFYCAAWANIGSVKNAFKSGFRPAWTELTCKDFKTIDDMLK